MPNGYNGKVLRVDLSTKETRVEEPGEKVYRQYLGGGALSLYYLLRELRPGVDPLGPDNILVFSASVLTGSLPAPGMNKYTVAAKSPLTGGFGESEAGGWWAPELKAAGYDAILIHGKAPQPVYLWIHDGQVEIRDAGHLWGKVTGEVQQILKRDLGDDRVRVLQIGPAGEKLVRYACIMNELKHFNGRCGLGAVMGSKNLRAIAVRGQKAPEPFDRDMASGILKAVHESYKEDPAGLGALGTARVPPILSAGGILPTKNFITGSFEKAEAISGKRLAETILKGRGTCHGCYIRCKREVEAHHPYAIDPAYGGPEYETIAAIGSLLEIGDLEAICKGNELCAQWGIDSISFGTTAAMAMECFEKGILKPKDTGGLELRFGNAEAMLKLIELVARREGIGDLLAEGAEVAAKKIGKGAQKYALHIKGQPLPMHEPRGKKSLALAYAVSPTGADHLENPHDPFFEKEGGLKDIHPFGILDPLPALDLGAQKVRMFAYLQQYYNWLNSIGLCIFVAKPFGPFTVTQLVEYTRAITGWDTSLWEALKVGERHSAMARIFNLREGIGSKDDCLPDRLHKGLEGGPLKGKKIDRREFAKALEMYYGMMGWDPKKGIPSQYKLEELNIGWALPLLRPPKRRPTTKRKK
jgi:aldehyde:ferredoxin oxidoreductase